MIDPDHFRSDDIEVLSNAVLSILMSTNFFKSSNVISKIRQLFSLHSFHVHGRYSALWPKYHVPVRVSKKIPRPDSTWEKKRKKNQNVFSFQKYHFRFSAFHFQFYFFVYVRLIVPYIFGPKHRRKQKIFQTWDKCR